NDRELHFAARLTAAHFNDGAGRKAGVGNAIVDRRGDGASNTQLFQLTDVLLESHRIATSPAGNDRVFNGSGNVSYITPPAHSEGNVIGTHGSPYFQITNRGASSLPRKGSQWRDPDEGVCSGF